MFAITIDAGSRTGVRVADRPELWYFLTPARVEINQTSRTNPAPPDGTATRSASVSVLPMVTGGDMMYVPKGAVRNVAAAGQPVKAVIVVAPGGREGTARGGALPTPAYDPKPTAPPSPKVLPATGARTYGPATIFLEPAVVKDAPYAASILTLAGGAAVPEHVHAHETELLFVLEGGGTMTIEGQQVAVTSSSVVQIPPNTKHAFTASSDVRAVQLYTPAGPEQRFKKKP
jgi:quercetin dioxygenase-like cupin family protein